MLEPPKHAPDHVHLSTLFS